MGADNYKNIRLDTSLFRSFAVVDDYFLASRAGDLNYLIKKTNSGDPVMTYPYSYQYTAGGDSKVMALETDGMNYWTLEVPYNVESLAEDVRDGTGIDFVDFVNDPSTSSEDKAKLFRWVTRWRVENFLFTMKDINIIYPPDINKVCNINTFAIEHYHDTLAQSMSIGDTTLKLTTPTACYFHTNNTVTIHNNTTGNYVDCTVNSVTDDYTVEVSSVSETIIAGSPISHTGYMYTFNNNDGGVVGTVEKRSLEFYIGPEADLWDNKKFSEVLSCYDSGLYKNINAAHFCTTSGVSAINNGYNTGYIIFVKGMQLFFKKPARPTLVGMTYPDGEVGTNLEFYNNDVSMMMYDLLTEDKTTIHSVEDLSSSTHPTTYVAENIYRLQDDVNYGGSDYSLGTYNYVVSVTTPLVTALTLVIEPAVLPADGISTTTIYATVTDQYGYPMSGKTVNFSASDCHGGQFTQPSMGGATILKADCPDPNANVVTGSQSGLGTGTAAVSWLVGDEAGYPIITATVTQ